MKSLFSRENGLDGRRRFSVFDISASILPLGVISVALLLVQLGGIALCPLFGYDAGRVWQIYGLISLALFTLSYALTVLGAVLLVFWSGRASGGWERERWRQRQPCGPYSCW